MPSVLMLVVILSILTFCVLLIQYFHYSAVAHEAAQLKADVAFQNGVVLAAAARNLGPDSVHVGDGMVATTCTYPWGLYRLVVSCGTSGRVVSRHAALLGQRATDLFQNALVYFNPEHQLVFAGEVRVVGNVQTGINGATLGVLEDMESLPSFPVTGSIVADASFHGIGFSELGSQIEKFDSLLNAAQTSDLPKAELPHAVSGEVDVSVLSAESVEQVVLDGNQILSGSLTRIGRPLRIIVLGNVTFSTGTTIYGPVQILSAGAVEIPSGTRIDYSILYSQSSIEMLSYAKCKAQLIAYRITLDGDAKLVYPSALISWLPLEGSTSEEDTPGIEPRSITLSTRVVVEGSVLMNKRPVAIEDPELIVVGPESKVIGMIYCGEEMTFDGTVIGTVITNDFYFYESPTRYFGWIRDGTIDRSLLPESYLTPILSAEGSFELDILDWV